MQGKCRADAGICDYLIHPLSLDSLSKARASMVVFTLRHGDRSNRSILKYSGHLSARLQQLLRWTTNHSLLLLLLLSLLLLLRNLSGFLSQDTADSGTQLFSGKSCSFSVEVRSRNGLPSVNMPSIQIRSCRKPCSADWKNICCWTDASGLQWNGCFLSHRTALYVQVDWSHISLSSTSCVGSVLKVCSGLQRGW